MILFYLLAGFNYNPGGRQIMVQLQYNVTVEYVITATFMGLQVT